MEITQAKGQLIAEQSRKFRFFNSIFSFIFVFLGFSLVVGYFINQLPPSKSIEGSAIILVSLGVPTATAFLAIKRNDFIKFLFNRISLSTFWNLFDFLDKLAYIMGSIAFISFIAGLATKSYVTLAFSFALFFFYTPFYGIFYEPLTENGKTRILFELLFKSLKYFEGQRWLKIVCDKFVNYLRNDHIKASSNDLIFYFNMELFKGDAVKEKLKNLEGWFLGEECLKFETICDIKEKFEVERKYVLLKQTFQNPTIIIYVLSLTILVTAWFLFPEFRQQIIQRLPTG